MNNEKIIFDTLLSIGCLDISTMNFFRLNNVEKSHEIFERIVAPFDFYYHDDILIIPDPIPKEKVNWNKMVSLYGQEIECIGRYVYFFHFDDISDYVNRVRSLTLPEYNYVEQGLKIS